MFAQGSSPINLQYFVDVTNQANNLVAQINYFKNGGFEQAVIDEVKTQVLNQLQDLADQIMPDIQAQVNGIQSSVTTLSPIVALATASISDLPSVISFLTSFQVLQLIPQIKPYATMLTQLTSLVAQVSQLTSAINAAASAIGGTVTVPAVTFPAIPVTAAQGSASGQATVAGAS